MTEDFPRRGNAELSDLSDGKKNKEVSQQRNSNNAANMAMQIIKVCANSWMLCKFPLHQQRRKDRH
jgi:hypothetical protein